MNSADKTESKIPRTVWTLGLVSLLQDISSEIVHGLLPVFLISVVGASYSTVGVIEGLGVGSSYVLKVFSGPLSDWLGKRKPFVIIGYLMGALSKPLFAIASTANMVLGARVFDRVGKGIRGAPRDALIAEVTPAEIRGAAFGLRQSLDNVGAIIGPLLGIGLMKLLHDNYRIVFWIAAVPALFAVALLFFGVEEPDVIQKTAKKIKLAVVGKFSTSFWLVAIAGGFLQLARFSEGFLILRAQNLGLTLSMAPLVLVVMNLIYAVTAYPVGKLSDRVPREIMLLIGFVILAVADVVLGASHGLISAFAGILLWGLHMAFTDGILAAMVVDTAGPEFRGTAFGLFNLVSAVALLVASVLAGALWDRSGPAATFYAAAAIAAVSTALFLIFRRLSGISLAHSKK